MEQAARQLVKAIRGRRSQLALSRRLGYRSNPVANWETGRRFPTARQWLLACERLGIDVQAAFERFLPAAARSRNVIKDLAGWLVDVRGSTPLSTVAQRAGCSRYAVSRLLHDKAEARLPDFLRLVEAMTGRVCDLCAELVPIDQVAALAPTYYKRQAARLLAFHEPWSEAILLVLDTQGYRDSIEEPSSYIARQLKLHPATVEHCLEELANVGLVESDGSRLRGVGGLTVDTQASPQLVQRVRAHWCQIALQRIPEARPGDQYGYNVFSVDEADLDRIRDTLRACFRDIRAIVANSRGNEHVALVNLQLTQLSCDPTLDESG